MSYKPYWNSLGTHITPKWFQDAKFGIYTHWGICSVPACGPNGTWYPYNMYREGTRQYKYHVKTYGHPSKFGYKDFIPMFKAEKFNPDEWAELFKKAGAQFAGPVGEHHDGFSMWDSQVNEWNAAKMGPKRDVVGELEKAVRKQGMKFVVALHHAENWWFFPHWKKEYDTADPRYTGLYGPPHNLEWAQNMPKLSKGFGGDIGWPLLLDEWPLQDKPSKEFLDKWLAKSREVIDKYQPDILWFDFGLRYIQEHYKRELLAYYYSKAEEWSKEVVVTYKGQDLAPGSGVLDLERSRFSQLTYHVWLTDTTVDDGYGWCYLRDAKYKTAATLVHYLIDIVSKNGSLLLNVGPKPNGEIPEEAKEVLLEMGRWLEVNGEAIYGTTPWMVYGEGPTKMTKSGEFNEDEMARYTAEDIRFTVKDDVLYAICLDWPDNGVTIKSMPEKLYSSEIKSVKMLGSDELLLWKMTKKGLEIKTPARRPCDYAYVFKIDRKHPFRTQKQ